AGENNTRKGSDRKSGFSDDRPKRRSFKDDNFSKGSSKEGFSDDRPKRRSFKDDNFSKGSSKEGFSDDRPKRRSFKDDNFSKGSSKEGFSDDRPKRRSFRDDNFSKGSSKEGFSDDRPKRRSFRDDNFSKGSDRDERPKRKTFSDEQPWNKHESGDRRRRKVGFSKENREGDGSVPKTPRFVKVEKPKITYRKKAGKPTLEEQDGKIRLNKYIANAGICSRREADDLIKGGVIKVNGIIVTEMGYRVSAEDRIQYGDQTLSKESKRYLLLNKPKDYITTSDDPEGRKTVMELVKNACKERLYPVGRLDRATTGLLLMTNDGELAKRLTHPSHQIRKVYHVSLDKNLKAIDLKRIAEGITLEDGLAEVDEISWIGEGAAKNEVGIALHSGKNRIVRRIFEHLGYEVTKLDRTYFAGLTKKNLARGKFRFLTDKEINLLKMT
ncbi:MAG: pseudouridine synthase, partial [Bacteroidia bacterium]|nr:pseudouridine synthase [Bacteroidia bacterium]